MYTVYVIKSINRNWFYVGMTSDLTRRLSQHNTGKTRSTKHYLPFQRIYLKSFKNRIEARDYEKFLKIKSNKEKIINTLK